MKPLLRGLLVLLAAAPVVTAQRQNRPDYRVALAETRGVFVAQTGNGVSQLLLTASMTAMPANGWSPNGSRLAFFALAEAGRLSAACRQARHLPLYVAGTAVAEGKEAQAEPLTDLVPLIEPEFAWARDDRRIAFSSGCEDASRVAAGGQTLHGSYTTALYVADAVTRQAVRVTEFVNARFPAWSPDDRQIAFSRSEAGGGSAVYIMDSDGTDGRRLTEGQRPAWSPTGEWIAFLATAKGSPGTFVIRPDGSGLRQVAPYASTGLRWSPDGARLLAPGASTVLVELASGSRTDLGELPDARFSPDSRLILYSAPDGIWSADLKGDKRQRLLPIAGGARLSSFSVHRAP